jgi:tRNA (cytidine32/guanosine34-2'-O)-methyltransferase
MGFNSKDRRDFYYYQAKVLKYRARSAFKLLDIDKTFDIFSNATKIVDLCGAPGSWSQVLRSKTDGKIISIDVQEMEPIEGICTLKEDITSIECLNKIESFFDGEKADLIVCDGAPDVTGLHDLDEFLQADLLKAALSICLSAGRIGSVFVGKCFRGEYSGYVLRYFLKFYESVELVKPRASRNASIECFLVCKGMKNIFEQFPLKSDQVDLLKFNVDGEPASFSLKSCGDGPDPDFVNDLEIDSKEYLNPVAPPINPPYKDSIESRRK